MHTRSDITQHAQEIRTVQTCNRVNAEKQTDDQDNKKHRSKQKLIVMGSDTPLKLADKTKGKVKCKKAL